MPASGAATEHKGTAAVISAGLNGMESLAACAPSLKSLDEKKFLVAEKPLSENDWGCRSESNLPTPLLRASPNMASSSMTSTLLSSRSVKGLRRQLSAIQRRQHASWVQQYKTGRLLAEFKSSTEAHGNDMKANIQISTEYAHADMKQLDNKLSSIWEALEVFDQKVQHNSDQLDEKLNQLASLITDATTTSTSDLTAKMKELFLNSKFSHSCDNGAIDVLTRQRDEALKMAENLEKGKADMAKQINLLLQEVDKKSQALESLQIAGAQQAKKFQADLVTAKTELSKAQFQLQQERVANGSQMLANVNKVSDSILTGKWKELGYSIRSLAYFVSGMKMKDSMTKDMAHVLKSIHRDHWTVMRSEDGRNDILQAYLWRILTGEVFHSLSRALATHPTHALFVLKTEFFRRSSEEHNPQCFAKWVSQASQHFEQMEDGSNTPLLNEMITAPLKSLVELIRNLTKKREAKPRIEEELLHIFALAFELHQTMLSSRACFYVRWPQRPLDSRYLISLDTSLMEPFAFCGDVKNGLPVRMVISPALVKAGNADGLHFDETMVLAKATVICD